MKYRVLKESVIEGVHFCPGQKYKPSKYMSEQALHNLIMYRFIEEIKDGTWEPKQGEVYEYISDRGSLENTKEYGTGVDEFRANIGNKFKFNSGDSNKALKWLKAFKVLRDDTKGFKPDWKDKEQGEWCVYYDSETGKLDTDCPTPWKSELIHFATEADAKESIKAHRSEWLRFLNIEEENETSNGK